MDIEGIFCIVLITQLTCKLDSIEHEGRPGLMEEINDHIL